MKKLEKLLQAIAVDVIFWAFGAMVIYFAFIAVVVPVQGFNFGVSPIGNDYSHRIRAGLNQVR